MLVSENNKEIYAQLVVAVVGSMANKMVDAAAMAKGLGDKGHIALYGIYFDTDKATIKPESEPTLDEMAKLLRGQPQMKVFVVGHTDSQGSYEHNMTLSRARADAVAAALTRSTRSRRRGSTRRVGYLAPTAPMPARMAARSTAGSSWSSLERRADAATMAPLSRNDTGHARCPRPIGSPSIAR